MQVAEVAIGHLGPGDVGPPVKAQRPLLQHREALLEAAVAMDAAGGVLEGRAMANTFNMLRSNDLIWSFVINNNHYFIIQYLLI